MHTRLLIAISLFTLSTPGSAQQTKDTLSIDFKNLPLELVLDSITFKTGYYFSYNADMMPQGSLYTLKRDHIYVRDLLEELLIGTDLIFTRDSDQIILRKTKVSLRKEEVSARSARKVEISGWVRNFETKSAIEGVNVFINGTTIGTVTDQHGNYRLTNVPFGSYILVFSHVGYEMASYSFKADKPTNYAINGLLDYKVLRLDQVQIESDPIVSEEVWPKYYRIFEKEFLGNTVNALRCDIINAEVLDFSYDESSKTLKAEAREPLTIENLALGYEISYELKHFEKVNTRTSFYGKAKFSGLDPENKRTRKKWRKARLKTYQGSTLHFFQTLISGDLKKEGFRIYRIEESSAIYAKNLAGLSPESILMDAPNSFEWKLSFEGLVLVNYEKELESTQYLNSNNESEIVANGIVPVDGLNHQKAGPQRSIMELKLPAVTLDHNGQVKEPLGLTTMGYWSWERMADLMPADYDPKSDNL